MNLHQELIETYEKRFAAPLHEQFFGNSGFSNYGYWLDSTENAAEACNNLVDRLLEFIPSKNGRVLDVACGQGGTTARLANHFYPSNISAINISEGQVAHVRKKAHGCTCLCMDAANLGFDDEVFDHIICVEAAFHFNTREKFFQESLRVLKPGGYMVLSDILFRRFPLVGRRQTPVANRHTSDASAYENLLLRTGFKDIVLLEALAQTWKEFRRRSLRFAARRLVADGTSLRNVIPRGVELILGVFGGLLYDQFYIKSYPLVAARKPTD